MIDTPTLGEAAEHYRHLGLRPVPCGRDKKPMVGWKPYQTEAPHPDEVDAWWQEWPGANIAIITGNGVLVVDLDSPDAEAALAAVGVILPPQAPRSRTGRPGGGWHVWLQVEGECRNTAGVLAPGVDIRADGGYVIVPPSLHASGTHYAWEIPFAWPLPPAPPALLALLTKPDRPPRGEQPGSPPPPPGERWVTAALAGVGEGGRNAMCARLAGYFLTKHPVDVVLVLLASWASRCTPPLDVGEVETTVRSVSRRATMNDTEPSGGDADPMDAAPSGSLADVGARWCEEVDYPPPRIPTPLGGLNIRLGGGFRAGELIYLGAVAGQGKTAFAMQSALAAARHDVPTLFVSMEMPDTALYERAMAHTGRLNVWDLEQGRVLPSTRARLMAELAPLPLWLERPPTYSIDGIVASIVRAESAWQRPLGFLVVDYLQLMVGGDAEFTRHELDRISRRLKQLALTRKIPVLCLSAVSRGKEDRALTMHSLRESGMLEHDADVVLLLYRETADSVSSVLRVGKARRGLPGKDKVLFHGGTQTFTADGDER